MDEKIKQELERLIEEGQYFNNLFVFNKGQVMDYYTFPKETDLQHKEWLEEIRLWTKNHYSSEYENIESLIRSTYHHKTPSLHDTLLSHLKAMAKYPQKKVVMKEEKKETSGGHVFNITQTQSQEQKQEQSQTQKMLQEVFSEAIKDELTGKQQKEIQAILEEHNDNIEEVKPKLLEKLASFGTNVLAGVVGNILTNPAMIGLF